MTFIARQLKVVVDMTDEETIRGLSEAAVHDILSSEDLFILDEITCFTFVATWFGYHDAPNVRGSAEEESYSRSLQSLESVIKLLRFHLISIGDLLQVIACLLAPLTHELQSIVLHYKLACSDL